MIDGQLASQAPSGAQDQIFVTVTQLWFCQCGASPLMRGSSYIALGQIT
jgi:hypothetical protein